VEVSGTALDTDGTVLKVEVQIDDDTWEEATDTSGSGNWSTWAYHWDTSAVSDGSHTITVRSLDNDGLNSIVDGITVTLDNTPPNIISGPTVSSKTDKKATIVWETDEPSDSYIEYWIEDSSDVHPENDSSFVTHHSIILTGLSPSTTYLFRVESTDLTGNSRRTDEDGKFTTNQPPDTTLPNAFITKPDDGEENLKGEVLITVDAWDDSGIDKVEFYINNKFKFTDDTPSYSWLWNTADGHYPDDQYTIKIVVIDTSGNEDSDEITVTLDNEIIEPSFVKKRVTPNSVMTGESTEVLFTVEVNDPENLIVSIIIDLSPIDGSSHQYMYDDGSHGDEDDGDNVYSFKATVPSDISEGDKSLSITLSYSEDGSIETSKTLYVIASDGGDTPDEGSNDEEDEERNMFWSLFMVFLIILAVIVSLMVAAFKRRRPKSEVQVVAPLYQTGYYQSQTGYYQDQTGYYQQEYYR
ncbi:MAG: Ig-like domain-containing protein, partial [Thermoplasmata archaeon]